MNQDLTASGITGLTPATGIGAVVNPPVDDWVELYDNLGRPYRVPKMYADEARSEKGLLPVRYDVADALAECVAAWTGALDAIVKTVAAMQELGYQRDEDALVMNSATNAAKETYGHLLFSLGALVPTESHIVALAEHRKLYGNLDRLPGASRYMATVSAYPEDRIAAMNVRSQEDAARQKQELEARTAAEISEMEAARNDQLTPGLTPEDWEARAKARQAAL